MVHKTHTNAVFTGLHVCLDDIFAGRVNTATPRKYALFGSFNNFCYVFVGTHTGTRKGTHYILLTASSRTFNDMCVYTSVTSLVACPTIAFIIRGSTPFSVSIVTKVCRVSCI